MHEPNQDLKYRLREARDYVPRMLAINTVIAIVLSWTTGISTSSRPAMFFAIQMTIAHFIGFTILFLISVINLQPLRESKLYFVALTAVFGVGGTVGATLATSLLTLFDIHITLGDGNQLFNVFALSVIFGLLAYGYFYLSERLKETAEDLAQKEVNEERLQRATTQAQLGALRARINPHFLFNTLNSMAELIHDQPDKAEAMVNQLAALLRAAIHSEDQHLSLAEELDLVLAYLEIEKVRLGERLHYQIDLPDNLRQAKIPGLLIQPLVENSVIHGISPKREGGSVHIRISQQDTKVQIDILDTGKGWKTNHEAEGRFGLSSVQERLRLHYQENATITIQKPDNQTGVLITITLPFQT